MAEGTPQTLSFADQLDAASDTLAAGLAGDIERALADPGLRALFAALDPERFPSVLRAAVQKFRGALGGVPAACGVRRAAQA